VTGTDLRTGADTSTDWTELLRFALAAVWTECDKDDPSLDDIMRIARESLHLSRGRARGRVLGGPDGTGLASWHECLAQKGIVAPGEVPDPLPVARDVPRCTPGNPHRVVEWEWWQFELRSRLEAAGRKVPAGDSGRPEDWLSVHDVVRWEERSDAWFLVDSVKCYEGDKPAGMFAKLEWLLARVAHDLADEAEEQGYRRLSVRLAWMVRAGVQIVGLTWKR
jgi:hypothetical protein